jgi:murein DD-endopeptidase MepM/ murein hydrolase activator NlpD
MRKKSTVLFAVLFAALAAGGVLASTAANAASTTTLTTASSTTASTSLEDQLKQKEQEISAVNQQILSAQQNLQTVQSQRVSLQQQVNLLNGNISTLNLNIQADTLTVQQLNLQIEQLNGDLGDISASIALKQAAIESILKDMERNDYTGGNLLALFLRNGTLADGVLEANNLVQLQSQLADDINTLTDLHQQYSDVIQQSTAKAAGVTSKQQDLQARKSILQDQNAQKQTLLASTKDKESVFQQQYSALQTQQAKINDEIEAISAILRTKIDPSKLPALAPGVLLVPVEGDTQADITQGYGATAFAQHEYVHHWHNGIDLAASIGTPILAADDGVVDAVANEDLYCPHGAYGKFITVNHPNGLTTLYAHLSKQIVSAGQTVKRGQVIGYSGNTGDVTGPHLHFTVFAQSTYYVVKSQYCGPLPEGGDLDPIGYLW